MLRTSYAMSGIVLRVWYMMSGTVLRVRYTMSGTSLRTGYAMSVVSYPLCDVRYYATLCGVEYLCSAFALRCPELYYAMSEVCTRYAMSGADARYGRDQNSRRMMFQK